MKGGIYLTIDDTPSGDTGALLDFLSARDIPAILFCRGDMMQKHGIGPVARAIEMGFTVGNHTFSHARASEQTFDFTVSDILSCEEWLDKAFAKAGRPRGPKYFRFPYLDRGTGTHVVDFDAMPPVFRAQATPLYVGAQNTSAAMPTGAQRDLRARLQVWLAAQGFAPLPCEGVNHPWYAETALSQTIDSLCTFTTDDWMLGPGHAGRWGRKTVVDLIAKMDADPFLNDLGSASIVLAHDKDGLLDTVRALVGHMQAKGARFLDLPGHMG